MTATPTTPNRPRPSTPCRKSSAAATPTATLCCWTWARPRQRRAAAPPTAPAAPPLPPPGPTLASFERGAKGKGKKAPPPPAEGTAFGFQPDVPRWVTADAEFRDRAGRFWPSFLYGKGVEGSAKVSFGGGLEGAFTVACTSAAQPKGDQSRRVLGELFRGEQPPALRLTIESLGKPRTQELAGTDGKGRPQPRHGRVLRGEGNAGVGRGGSWR